MQSSSCPLAPVGLETWLPESLGLERPGSEGRPGVGRSGWLLEPGGLERPGSGGWPGVGRSGERPEFGLRKLAAGLRGLELCPVGAGPVSVEGWQHPGSLTGYSPLSSVELFPYQEFRYWKKDVDEGRDIRLRFWLTSLLPVRLSSPRKMPAP